MISAIPVQYPPPLLPKGRPHQLILLNLICYNMKTLMQNETIDSIKILMQNEIGYIRLLIQIATYFSGHLQIRYMLEYYIFREYISLC